MKILPRRPTSSSLLSSNSVPVLLYHLFVVAIIIGHHHVDLVRAAFTSSTTATKLPPPTKERRTKTSTSSVRKGSSTDDIQKSNSYYNFRSAKKISGASSVTDLSEPIRPSTWTQSSSSSKSSPLTTHPTARNPPRDRTRLFQSVESIETPGGEDDDDEDDRDGDEAVEPEPRGTKTMRISEIKAELALREVPYDDCFDKESLVARLDEARSMGKANPKLLDEFNRQKLEETFDPTKKLPTLSVDDIAKATSNDGKLPGGMSPDQFLKLSNNPEIMALLQSTKLQEAMKLMMSGGRDQLEAKVKDDPELQATLSKLDAILKETS